MNPKMRRMIDESPHLLPGEAHAVTKTLEYAETYGYGNLMAWMATAWAVKLRDDGLSEKTAVAAVSNRTPYALPK